MWFFFFKVMKQAQVERTDSYNCLSFSVVDMRKARSLPSLLQLLMKVKGEDIKEFVLV